MTNKVYLAGGCFWGMQAYFSKLNGVIETVVGYANGNTNQTNYKEIKNTNHAEVVCITYDEKTIYLAEIIERFYKLIDPYSINKQGGDEGTQYRTGLFFDNNNTDGLELAKSYNKFYEKKNGKKNVIIIEKLRNFVKAEEYHQNYLDKNPNGYCHIDVNQINKPLHDYKKLSNSEIQKLNLQPLTMSIMLEKDTETPFTSEFNNFNEKGLYIDKISKEPLFISDDKFDAGCGWPSFTRPVCTTGLSYYDDFSIAERPRIEVTSKIQDSHLGHVFKDGPKDKTGLRYCINGECLLFIKYEELENTPYENFKFYFKNK